MSLLCFLAVLCVIPAALSRCSIPCYLTCPGVEESEIGTKLQIRVGVILIMPANINKTQLLTSAGLGPGDLIPGELLMPYAPLALVASKSAENINNDTTLLPYHHLCLYYTFVPRDFRNIALGPMRSYSHQGVYLIINAVKSRVLQSAISKQVVYLRPLLSVEEHWSLNSCPGRKQARLIMLLVGQEVRRDVVCSNNVNIKLGLTTTKYNLFLATYTFVRRMNWRRFGILTTCKECLEIWPGDEHVIISYYDSSDIISSFAPFKDEEIDIYIFIGSTKTYLRMLLEFNKRRKSYHRLFTWILPYYCPSFSKVYERIFSKYFKPAEIKRIEFELRGSIVIHPAERFKNEDSRIISGFQSWGLRSAGYILDALTYEVITAEKVLNAKAKRLNVSVSQVPLKSADKVKLTTTFLNTSFYGETGTVLFSKECNRLTNIFNILNFIPTETGLIHHHIAGLISQGPSNNSILYLHNNGTLSGGSTLIFNDGTSNIPADYKKKLFTRYTSVSASVMISFSFLYFLLATGYIAFVSYQDKLANTYSEAWLYQHKDVKFTNGSFADTTLSSLLQILQPNLQDNSNIGEINGKIVKVHKMRMNLSALDVNLRKTMLQILKFDHDNVCPFVGCILQGSTIVGMMYEYCSHGSLYNVLRNPNIVFDKQFRVLFATDIIKGLMYLHSHKMTHGRLSSENCVIGNLWKLKLTDYGPEGVHSKRISDKRKRSSIHYDCCSNDIPSDIYNFGIVLKEMSCRKHLLKDKMAALDELEYDIEVPAELQKLIENCMSSNFFARPSTDWIKSTLKYSIAKCGLSQDVTGVAEVNLRNLENSIEELKVNVSIQKQDNDLILGKCMPSSFVQSVRDKSFLPLQKYNAVTLVCISLVNIEKDYTVTEIPAIIEKVDKVLHGAASNGGLIRLQAVGSLWVYACGIYDSLDKVESPSCCIVNPVKVTCLIKNALEDCQHQLVSKFALHTGPLTCGSINTSAPFHVVLGQAIASALSLLYCCPNNSIVVSETVKALLSEDYQMNYLDSLMEEDGNLLPYYKLYAVADLSTSRLSFTLSSDSKTQCE